MATDCNKSTFCQRRTDQYLHLSHSGCFSCSHIQHALTNNSILKQIHNSYPAVKWRVSSYLKPIMHVNAILFQPTDYSTSTTLASWRTQPEWRTRRRQTCWVLYSEQGGSIKETQPRRWKSQHRGPAYTVCLPVCLLSDTQPALLPAETSTAVCLPCCWACSSIVPLISN